MATQIAYADGNLTGATTFKTAEVGSGALALIRNSNTGLGQNSNISSSSFTITNAVVIEGVLLWLQASSATPAGTLLVELQKSAVTQASVTVNCADLPPSTLNTPYAPVFFKFTSTATGDGTANWTIKLTVSNTANAGINYERNSGTNSDFTRALRTSTTATAAAGDDLYIVGELTGAGTKNTRTVTMDSTATTAYGSGVVNSSSVNGGGIKISNWGTLTYGTAASTNYVLRVNGDVDVFSNGTLTIGATGAEIPRTSTAVLEFQPTSAQGDFGLICRNNSTTNIAGLSRTSGKNVTNCKLNATFTSASTYQNNAGLTNATTAQNGLDSSGFYSNAWAMTDNVTNGNHCQWWQIGASVAGNTTETFTVWLARGSGTNNRYFRVQCGNNQTFGSVTNGFYADVDLQAGTIGSCTAIGNGTATSATIAAVGGGYLIRLTGAVSSASTNTYAFVAACSAAGTTSYAGNTTQNCIFDHSNFVNGTLSDTSLTVDTDTGWLSGDVIAIASTSRTSGESETLVLNANAGASSMTSALYPWGNANSSGVGVSHLGVAPTQAEVILLTRNVKIRTYTNANQAYVYMEALATMTASWAEFYWMGSNNGNKWGIGIQGNGSACPAKSFSYCSVHDMSWQGFYLNAGNFYAGNVTIDHCVLWNTQWIGIQLNQFAYTGDYTITNTIIVKGQTTGFQIGDMTGTFTGNTAAGCNGTGFTMNGPSTFPAGTMNNVTVHSNNGKGFQIGSGTFLGTMGMNIDTLKLWRNNDWGFQIQGTWTTQDLSFSNLTMFGNNNGSMTLNSGDGLTVTGTNILCGDTSFSSGKGIDLSSQVNLQTLNISGVDFSGGSLAGSIGANNTTDDLFFQTTNTQSNPFQGVVNNCKFGSAPFNTKNSWTNTSYIGMEKYNQTAGDHRTEMKYGQLKTDSVIYNTASPSMRMTPNSATGKLQSAPLAKGIQVAVASGTSVSISVNVRKSVVGDGTAYNGNQPRLIQRRNPALGQDNDVVLATYTAAGGSWNLLSAVSSTATDDGVWEFIVDCDGTTGWINVDDWSAST